MRDYEVLSLAFALWILSGHPRRHLRPIKDPITSINHFGDQAICGAADEAEEEEAINEAEEEEAFAEPELRLSFPHKQSYSTTDNFATRQFFAAFCK